MRIFRCLLALAALPAIQAHTLFSTFYVNGNPQGNGTCLRQPIDPDTATNPLQVLTSTDLACGMSKLCQYRVVTDFSRLQWFNRCASCVFDI
jgi:hypothetical protein